MKKIKVAQIGTSMYSHGNHIFLSLMKNNDIFEIAGYVFPENEKEKFPENVKLFADYKELTLDEVLNNPEIEAVIIETEEKYLTKYALLCAQHKKHIHMEKPGGMELGDFEELIRIVKENKKIFHTGYMYRYNPYVMELKEQIKSGELGEILSVEAHMSCLHTKEMRHWLGDYPGGMMFFLGCHLIDIILSIQGKPKNIIPLNKCSGLDGINTQDSGMVIFEYENGVSFAKTTAVEVGGFERRQLVVTGSEKTVELKPLEWYIDEKGPITAKTTYQSTDWNTSGTKEMCAPFDRYGDMMRSFAEMVAGTKENPVSYDYELLLYKTILDACK